MRIMPLPPKKHLTKTYLLCPYRPASSSAMEEVLGIKKGEFILSHVLCFGRARADAPKTRTVFTPALPIFWVCKIGISK